MALTAMQRDELTCALEIERSKVKELEQDVERRISASCHKVCTHVYTHVYTHA